MPGLLRQAVYGRLAGYEDVNDAERLARDPVMRAIIGREGMDRPAASTSQMGRFETEWPASEANLAALTDLSGAWIWFRGDAALAKPELYELLEAEGISYAIRMPANAVLQERIGRLLTRPTGRPPMKPQVFFASFSYHAQ